MDTETTNVTEAVTTETEQNTGTENAANETTEQDSGSDEIAKLRAQLAKQKLALDKATHEAGEARKALRARQTAEEIAAEEKRVADEAKDNELKELRKQFAVANISKKVMSLGGDEEASGRIAELLYGAEDVDNALTELQKLWTAREKALKLEFGRIPAPGAGAEDTAEKRAIDTARSVGKARADADKLANDTMKVYLR